MWSLPRFFYGSIFSLQRLLDLSTEAVDPRLTVAQVLIPGIEGISESICHVDDGVFCSFIEQLTDDVAEVISKALAVRQGTNWTDHYR